MCFRWPWGNVRCFCKRDGGLIHPAEVVFRNAQVIEHFIRMRAQLLYALEILGRWLVLFCASEVHRQGKQEAGILWHLPRKLTGEMERFRSLSRFQLSVDQSQADGGIVPARFARRRELVCCVRILSGASEQSSHLEMRLRMVGVNSQSFLKLDLGFIRAALPQE